MLIQLAGLLLLTASLSQAVGTSSDCARDVRETAGCPTVTGTMNDDTVDLIGNYKTGEAGDDTNSEDPSSDPFADCANPVSTTCVRPYPATVTSPVTLAEIAEFRPDPAVDHMEPNGWTIAGLDTNFYATGGGQVVYGTLLGQPAVVRFTPVWWHWSYGDGTAAGHPFPGGTWAAQGIAEFDPTGTSHAYKSYGTYYIDLEVDLAAEYRFANGPWIDINGALTVQANRLVITVGNAKTVLVERECTRNPGGPGC